MGSLSPAESDGLIPLLLPLRYNKEKLNDGGQSSATGRSAPLDRRWKEQFFEATSTLANLAARPTSTDSYEDQAYNSLSDSFEDKRSETADLSGIASEVSTCHSDIPTLGYACFSTPSATLQGICCTMHAITLIIFICSFIRSTVWNIDREALRTTLASTTHGKEVSTS